ncbi:MAG: GspE/PulE family protein [Pseudomonadota bacterium]
MRHPFAHRLLGEILIEQCRIRQDELERALLDKERRLGEALLKESALDGEALAQALAEQCQAGYANLDGFIVPPDLFELISAAQAYQLGIVPMERGGRVLRVAAPDPFDLGLLDRLERQTGLRIELVVASPAAIAAALKRSEGAYEVLKDVSEDFKLSLVVEGEAGADQYVTLDSVNEEGAGPVVKLINTLLLAALQQRASDVHIEVFSQGITVKYRVDGVLYPATDILDRRHHAALISRLKVMAELDIAEKRIPQDGRFKLRYNSRDIDFRVSVLPSAFGEDVVIRVLDKSSITDGVKNLRLDKLGIDSGVLKRLRKITHSPYGMMLITGPTGSGKTTTLYAALSELDTGAEKIITIEDPVEYQLDGIVQIPVNDKKGLTFAKGLRSILRHDPDKIMVGEIRDGETAKIAIQSALTGHLVFSTVHANNAIDVIWRFTHMGVDLYDFISALNAVMAQRLMRVICPRCKQRVEVNVELLEISGFDPGEYRDHTWFEGRGCEYCNGTGYRGRTVIAELLLLTPRIRQMVIERRSFDEIQIEALVNGMVTLRQAALAKALAGETTLKEINRVTLVA